MILDYLPLNKILFKPRNVSTYGNGEVITIIPSERFCNAVIELPHGQTIMELKTWSRFIHQHARQI